MIIYVQIVNALEDMSVGMATAAATGGTVTNNGYSINSDGTALDDTKVVLGSKDMLAVALDLGNNAPCTTVVDDYFLGGKSTMIQPAVTTTGALSSTLRDMEQQGNPNSVNDFQGGQVLVDNAFPASTAARIEDEYIYSSIVAENDTAGFGREKDNCSPDAAEGGEEGSADDGEIDDDDDDNNGCAETAIATASNGNGGGNGNGSGGNGSGGGVGEGGEKTCSPGGGTPVKKKKKKKKKNSKKNKAGKMTWSGEEDEAGQRLTLRANKGGGGGVVVEGLSQVLAASDISPVLLQAARAQLCHAVGDPDVDNLIALGYLQVLTVAQNIHHSVVFCILWQGGQLG